MPRSTWLPQPFHVDITCLASPKKNELAFLSTSPILLLLLLFFAALLLLFLLRRIILPLPLYVLRLHRSPCLCRPVLLHNTAPVHVSVVVLFCGAVLLCSSAFLQCGPPLGCSSVSPVLSRGSRSQLLTGQFRRTSCCTPAPAASPRSPQSCPLMVWVVSRRPWRHVDPFVCWSCKFLFLLHWSRPVEATCPLLIAASFLSLLRLLRRSFSFLFTSAAHLRPARRPARFPVPFGSCLPLFISDQPTAILSFIKPSCTTILFLSPTVTSSFCPLPSSSSLGPTSVYLSCLLWCILSLISPPRLGECVRLAFTCGWAPVCVIHF